MTSDRAYSITFIPAARDDFARHRGLETRIAQALRSLAERPNRGHPLTGSLANCRSLVLSRSSGGFRPVYAVNESLRRCVVIAIGPHATVYELAASRYAALSDDD